MRRGRCLQSQTPFGCAGVEDSDRCHLFRRRRPFARQAPAPIGDTISAAWIREVPRRGDLDVPGRMSTRPGDHAAGSAHPPPGPHTVRPDAVADEHFGAGRGGDTGIAPADPGGSRSETAGTRPRAAAPARRSHGIPQPWSGRLNGSNSLIGGGVDRGAECCDVPGIFLRFQGRRRSLVRDPAVTRRVPPRWRPGRCA